MDVTLIILIGEMNTTPQNSSTRWLSSLAVQSATLRMLRNSGSVTFRQIAAGSCALHSSSWQRHTHAMAGDARQAVWLLLLSAVASGKTRDSGSW